MSSYLQLQTFIYSFIYGYIFYILSKFNLIVIKNKSLFWQFITSFIFVIDMLLIYTYFNYQLNNGYFHIYFLLIIIIGYIIGSVSLKKICQMCVKIYKKYILRQNKYHFY